MMVHSQIYDLPSSQGGIKEDLLYIQGTGTRYNLNIFSLVQILQTLHTYSLDTLFMM